jgi:hypothetical protein
MNFADIVIRIDENLDQAAVRELELDLQGEEGVYEVGMLKNRRHLLFVDYDPDRVQPDRIVHSIRAHGLNAEMIVA